MRREYFESLAVLLFASYSQLFFKNDLLDPVANTMSVKRALVDCVVLSLQDSSVFYPSCRGCFSRIDVEQPDGTR